MLIRGGIPLMALTFFNLIYGTIDVPILESSRDGSVAWYSLAYRWISIPSSSPPLPVGYFPRFSALGKEQTAVPRLVNRAIRLVLLVSVPARSAWRLWPTN